MLGAFLSDYNLFILKFFTKIRKFDLYWEYYTHINHKKELHTDVQRG